MGSIGYIGGNMGYMGAGPIGIEYPFEGNSTHYQLWKPPNGYFPRGEAPPPYEEAVALAQADTMNTQCTVSVATTTHRTLPIGVNTIENAVNESQTSLTTSTTNLINININNAGNLTTVATGEHHQAPYSPCNILSLSNQPRSTQTHSNCSSSSSSSIGEPSNILTRNQTNQMCVQSVPLQVQQNATAVIPVNSYNVQQQQQQQQHQQNQQNLLQSSSQYPGLIVECMYKNCTLNSKVISSKNHKNNVQENIIRSNLNGTEINNIEHSKIVGIDSNDVNKSTTILPPPLFDESVNGYSVTSHEIVKTPSSSRRYHRTIPRHFAAADPLITNTKTSDAFPSPQQMEDNEIRATTSSVVSISTSMTPATTAQSSTNKKPTCQCPVQHVPMTYMGSSHFPATPHSSNVFLSTLSTKLVNCKPSNLNTKTTLSSSSFSSGKIQTISKQNIENKAIFATKIEPHLSGGTLKGSNRRHSSNTSTSLASSNNASKSNKISTISRRIVDLKHEQSLITDQQIPSILKTSKEKSHNSNGHTNSRNVHCNTSTNGLKTNCEEPFNPPFPIQFIDGISKLSKSSASLLSSAVFPENPVLPPKMHKNSNLKQTPNSMFVSKIHTITKANNEIHHESIPPRTSSVAPRLSSSYHHINNSTIPTLISNTITHTKSLPRKDDRITHALTLPNSGSLSTSEKSQSLCKINSTTYYPIQNGHATYTLPKHNSGKVSLNSTIASVVSKVPSVISIPTSLVSHQQQTQSTLKAVGNRNSIGNNIEHQSVTALSSNTTLKNSITISNNNDLNLHLNTNSNSDNKNVLSSSPSEISKSPKFQSVPTEPSNAKSINYIIPKIISTNVSSKLLSSSSSVNVSIKPDDKPLPVCTTSKNCSNPKEHFLPNDTSLDDDYLSECENCKTAHSSRYYLSEGVADAPPETMTLQRKMDDKEEEQTYYRTSLTLPTNTKKTVSVKNNRETWFSSIPASSSSDEETNE